MPTYYDLFTGKSCLQESQISGKVLSKEGLCYVDEHQMSEHLKELKISLGEIMGCTHEC